MWCRCGPPIYIFYFIYAPLLSADTDDQVSRFLMRWIIKNIYCKGSIYGDLEYGIYALVLWFCFSVLSPDLFLHCSSARALLCMLVWRFHDSEDFSCHHLCIPLAKVFPAWGSENQYQIGMGERWYERIMNMIGLSWIWCIASWRETVMCTCPPK